MMSHPSKNAAAVILLRPAVKGEFEVFLTHRSVEMKSPGVNYSFSGGSVKREDCLAAILRRCRGINSTEARKILGSELTPELSLGHWVASVRGLFEGAGVLLCTTEDGRSLDMSDRQVREKLAHERKALSEGSKGFLTLLESQGFFCDTARLVYFSQWLVPEDSPTRMDTRFFLALLPLGQTLPSGSQETEHSLWIAPERALDLCQQATLPMTFPTFASLRTLADFDSWEAIAAEYGLR